MTPPSEKTTFKKPSLITVEEGDSLNKQKMWLVLMLLSTNSAAKYEMDFILTKKSTPRRGFILKPKERPYMPLKNEFV